MTPRPVLLAAAAALILAGRLYAEPIDVLLNEKAKSEVAQLTKDPVKNKARLDDISRITREFADWQKYENGRERYAKLSKDEQRDLIAKFKTVVKEDAVKALQNDIEPRGGEDDEGWEDRLSDFWKCYLDPKSCGTKKT